MNTLDMQELWDELTELQDRQAEEGIDDDEEYRLTELVDLFAELGNERAKGLILYAEDDFADYAREYAEDITDNAEFLFVYVDWDAFASDLRMDYRTVEFDGTTYLYR